MHILFPRSPDVVVPRPDRKGWRHVGVCARRSKTARHIIVKQARHVRGCVVDSQKGCAFSWVFNLGFILGEASGQKPISASQHAPHKTRPGRCLAPSRSTHPRFEGVHPLSVISSFPPKPRALTLHRIASHPLSSPSNPISTHAPQTLGSTCSGRARGSRSPTGTWSGRRS
jgi:hypothetical protein